MKCLVRLRSAQTGRSFAFSQRKRARVVHRVSLPRKQRAQGIPGARRTHCLTRRKRERAQAQHRYAEIIRHSLRNGFTAAPRSPRSTGLLASVALSNIIDKT